MLYMALYLALNSYYLSLPLSLTLSFTFFSRIFLSSFFLSFFVCFLNANYSYIQFALKIGNLRSKECVSVKGSEGSEWVSFSIYFFSLFLSFSPSKERKFPTNSTSISNGFSLSSHSHCHSKMHTFILSRVFSPWSLDVLLARLLLFHFNSVSFTRQIG